MIQRSSVPSLLSFWDERFLDSWFDAEKPSVSSVLATDALAPYPKVAIDTELAWNTAETSATSAHRHSAVFISKAF